MTISVTRATALKAKPDGSDIGFGTHTTDHLFLADYRADTGWINPRVEPYQGVRLDPTALALHYGCSIFEGLKMFRQPDGRLAIFRPLTNAERLNHSARLMALPDLPTDLFLDGLLALVRMDEAWTPTHAGYTLYARPVMLGIEPTLGVQRPKQCLFYILLTPTPPYYRKGQRGFRLLADRRFARGGPYSVAAAKTAGNYGKMVLPIEEARRLGFDTVLWLDGRQQRFIEEAGITNIFVVYRDCIVTPPLNGRILPGVTRDSTLTLLRERGLPVQEAETPIDALCAAIKAGDVREVFLTGTATVVAPVSSISFEGRDHVLPSQTPLAAAIYDTLTGIQAGVLPDKYGWLHHV